MSVYYYWSQNMERKTSFFFDKLYKQVKTTREQENAPHTKKKRNNGRINNRKLVNERKNN